MKICEIIHFRLDMELAEPYTIAYETVSQASNIIVKLVADNGLTGWGCAAPDLAVTGETPEQVSSAADETLEGLLLGENPFQIARTTHHLKKLQPSSPAFLAMVDMALFDLLARKAGLPLYQLLGGFRHKIATSITIGIVSLEETLALVEKHLKNGFQVIKLKGGLNLVEDSEKVLKIREKFGHGFALRFDANQGYSLEESMQFMTAVKGAGLEIFEQPTSQNKDESLGRVSQFTPVPVMADESIKTLKDAFRLAADEHTDMVNIKLMKMGGIFESLHVNSVAKAAGLEVMVGCLDESALGISAGLHFALSRANIEFADLDGHLDLIGDPFEGLFHLENGVLYPSDSPGLGAIDI
jgi:L-alanine-DL-glutamate epimerase-like enolase superfamily enzyme